jgi:two-component system C4-dicarboxylate transport response regulator DctD
LDQLTHISRRRPTIVLVEDDRSLLNALVFALEADGFDVHAYTSAKPVLASPFDADCMVIDLKLPDLDGLTLVARLRELGSVSPAILITTNPDGRSRRAAAIAGVQIVEKPLMTGELRARIDEAIATHS